MTEWGGAARKGAKAHSAGYEADGTFSETGELETMLFFSDTQMATALIIHLRKISNVPLLYSRPHQKDVNPAQLNENGRWNP